MTPDEIAAVVRRLASLDHETEWVEFKTNNEAPETLGENLSAVSNGAALRGKPVGYLVWGVRDDTHEIVGTTFQPKNAKKGNEDLEAWLLKLLNPRLDVRIHEGEVDGKRVVLIEVPAAAQQPTRFSGREYIRVGSYTKPLSEYPAKEKALWRLFDSSPFEEGTAARSLAPEEVVDLLDHTAYFRTLNLPVPADLQTALDAMSADEMLSPTVDGRWDVTNLGAALFAKDLGKFSTLRRKKVRIIVYAGNDKIRTKREHEEPRGYAAGFEDLMQFVNSQLPSNEVIETAIRKVVPVYPELAVRELVANALIHQDFSVTGAGPMLEIFDDRMEITNPGAPLVSTERFLDSPPRSRNEALAAFTRRIGVCEERGSGIDKVVFQTEFYQLPPPAFEQVGENTRTVLFAPRKLSQMDKADRVWACYLHACLKYVRRDYLTNTSVRERFGIAKKNSAAASRIIADAVAEGKIRLHDEDAAKKLRKYVPFWA